MIFQFLTVLLIIFKVVAEEDLKEGHSCITPNKENATCIPLKKCKVIMSELGKFTPEAFQFAKISECGSGRGLICCGSLGYVTTKTFSTKPIDTTTLATEDDIILSDFSDKSICGLHAYPANRVKGGHVADLEDFPWTAALEYESNYDKKNVGIKCGGSLISHTFILTAAHCTIHHELVVIRAWLGVSNLTSAQNCLNFTNNIRCANSIHKVNIEETIPNYDYERLGQINDIALLKIKYVWFTDYIRPICLPSSNSPTPKLGTMLTVVGWGYADNNNPSEVKLTVDLPLQNNSICNAALQVHGNVIDSKQLCVGGEKGEDSCQGDSGGPLMRTFIGKNKESRWLQEGIVSYGVGCGIKTLPAVYVNVSAYIDWIINKTYEFETNYKDLKEGDSCVTPNQERAKCVQIENCDVIIAVLNNFTVEAFSFFTDSQCGYSREVVCCGTMGYKKIEMDITELPRTMPSPDENKDVVLSDYSDESLCGLDQSTDRILGGVVAQVDEFPWLAALEYKSKLDNKNAGIRCGGSVISHRYILTAAHCIDHEELMIVKVWLGVYNITSNKTCEHFAFDHDEPRCWNSVEKLAVEKTISHPRYDHNRQFNDIGLLRVKHIKYNDYIRPICLPSPNTPLPQIGTYMTIAGWGLTENGTSSDIKLKLNVPTQNNAICNKVLEGSKFTLNSKQLCAGGERGKDACQGDSGGPLMKQLQSNVGIQWIQEGLISYGTGCGKVEPTIYTRVPSYEIWITKTIRDVETDLEIGDDCTTPYRTIGTCVPLQKCSAVFDATATTNLISHEFAKKSYCGYQNQTLVCCETPSPVITVDLKSKAIPDGFRCGVVEEEARNNDEEVAKVGEFPWMADIEYNFRKTGKTAGIKCAGSLINNDFVLTAANCLLKKTIEPISVWLGGLSTSEDPNCEVVECRNTLQKVLVQKSIPHVFYNAKTGHNNIGLIQMERPVQFNKYVSPICLPFASSPLPDSETHIIVIARGITENDKYSNILKTAKLSIISSEACGEMFSNKEYLCVNVDPDTNDCEGNEGAALIRISEDRRFQEGVVSDKIDCQSGKSVSFHTRVANYLDWIVNIISENQFSN